MEERRKCTTVRQLELLVDFLEVHRDLALGRVRTKEARAVSARLWREFADMVNSEGPPRTGKEWAKVWNDYKCRVRTKIVGVNVNQATSGAGGPSTATSLTTLEEKVANILGRDVKPLLDVRQDHSSSNDGDAVMEIVDEQAPNVHLAEASPAISLNVNQSQYVATASSPVHVHPMPESPVPSVLGQAPSLNSTPTRATGRVLRDHRRGGRRRTERATSRCPRTQAVTRNNNRTALEESRAMVLNIEQVRAQAALNYSQAFASLTESFKLIAESIERCTQKYCSQESNPQP